MILNIKTNGATNLVVHIPTDKLSSAEGLIKMVENNMVAYHDGWNNVEVTELTTSLTLGDTLKVSASSSTYSSSEGNDLFIDMSNNGDVPESFELATPTLYASNKETLDKYRDQLKKLENKVKLLEIEKEELELELQTLKE